LLSYWFFTANFAGGAALEAVSQAKIMVNPQTLITPHHGLSLVVSSRFARASVVRFRFDSRFFRKFRETGVELTCEI
jgi:hypothetical protein